MAEAGAADLRRRLHEAESVEVGGVAADSGPAEVQARAVPTTVEATEQQQRPVQREGATPRSLAPPAAPATAQTNVVMAAKMQSATDPPSPTTPSARLFESPSSDCLTDGGWPVVVMPESQLEADVVDRGGVVDGGAWGGSLMEGVGPILFQGWVLKRSVSASFLFKNWRRRYLVLRGPGAQQLVGAASIAWFRTDQSWYEWAMGHNTEAVRASEAAGELLLGGAVLSAPVDGCDHRLSLEADGHELIFECDEAPTANRWRGAIADTIKAQNQAILRPGTMQQSRRRQSHDRAASPHSVADPTTSPASCRQRQRS